MSDDNKYAMLLDPDMAEIVESFIIETHEILEELDHDLVELENKPDDEKSNWCAISGRFSAI